MDIGVAIWLEAKAIWLPLVSVKRQKWLLRAKPEQHEAFGATYVTLWLDQAFTILLAPI